jgi:hypothetical protein
MSRVRSRLQPLLLLDEIRCPSTAQGDNLGNHAGGVFMCVAYYCYSASSKLLLSSSSRPQNYSQIDVTRIVLGVLPVSFGGHDC